MKDFMGGISRVAEWWRKSGTAQTLTFVLVDAGIVWSAVVTAYVLRFEGAVPGSWAAGIPIVVGIGSALYIAAFFAGGLYNFVWKYVGVGMVMRLAVTVALGTVALTATVSLLLGAGAREVPVSIPLITGAFVFLEAAAFRSLGRLLVYMSAGVGRRSRKVLIIGAGDAGSLLLRDIENQPRLGTKVVGFLDDDRSKHGRMIRSAKVLGPIDLLPQLAVREDVDEVFIAILNSTVAERRRILDLCNEVGLPVRMISGLAPSGSVGVAELRPVSVEDLLGRDPVTIDETLIRKTIEGKVVAVTGAAGSIGSELCRQILKMDPARLLLVEIDETRLFELNLELEALRPGICVMCLLDIRDEAKLAGLFISAKPAVVFHAAAYKHVPMMELSPDEAIKTNVGGTASVLRASAAAAAERFVLISTDKAVQPVNVMGATKAVAERLAMLAARHDLTAVVVRFGNVLASRGSVIPLFTEQIRKGGPLRVTHPEATRYFMTIPEAARLVLQSQALSESGGEIYVLDMGEPIKIVDLARKMIALSRSDVRIEFTGLRPGEKVHEVLVHDGLELVPTACEKVSRVSARHEIADSFAESVEALLDSARRRDREEMQACLRAALPDYRPEDGSRGQHHELAERTGMHIEERVELA